MDRAEAEAYVHALKEYVSLFSRDHRFSEKDVRRIGIRGKKKQAYFAAIQAGLDRNYVPMKSIFSEVIGRTVSKPWKS